MKPVLSILIPTYERSRFLQLLLKELEAQLTALPLNFVEVVISDNCSTDNTGEVVKPYLLRNNGWRYVRHSYNIGADANFLSLISTALGRFFWILGDDDIPRKGLISSIALILEASEPSLLYLPPLGFNIVNPDALEPLHKLTTEQLPPKSIANKVSHYITFMSCWIIDNSHLAHLNIELDANCPYLNTNLVQLYWTLPILVNSKSKLMIAKETCIMSTIGNSGGYNVLKTFCLNFPDIIYGFLGKRSPLAHAIIAPYVNIALPGLIYAVRSGKYYQPGSLKGVVPQVTKRFWRFPAYWILSLPTFWLPLPLLRLAMATGKKIKCCLTPLGPVG